MTHILDELQWRGLVAHSTDEQALREVLGAGPARPATFYVGFDPTAPSLHIGNLVQILTARRLQLAGHRPLALVGGATGLIGDPKANAERALNEADVVAGWVQRIRAQIVPLLDLDGPAAATLVDNLDWTASLSAIDLLRDVGRHFRVGTMIRKEVVATRLASPEGISYTEFSYQVLQALDYLELHRRHGCVLQLGGSDQWGNITAGVDLVHKAAGAQVHALATPLVTKADGTKFGKTESGTVWLDPQLTSPFAFYQFWLNAEDASVGAYLRIFTFLPRHEIEQLEQDAAQRPAARAAQRALAREATTVVHGPQATQKVEAASASLFGGGDLAALDPATLSDALAEVPRATAERSGLRVVDLLVATGLAASRGAARRTIVEGGAHVNNSRVQDVEAVVPPSELLHDRWLVLRRGRRTLAAVEVR